MMGLFFLCGVCASHGDVLKEYASDEGAGALVKGEIISGNLQIKNSLMNDQAVPSAFKFTLPPELRGKEVNGALLRLTLNNRYDDKDKTKGSGPRLKVYGSWSLTGESHLTMADFTDGDDLQLEVKRFFNKDRPKKQQRQLTLDVTTCVNQALKGRAYIVTFRLQPERDNGDPSIMTWNWRSPSFAAKHGKPHAPQLVLYAERSKVPDRKAVSTAPKLQMIPLTLGTRLAEFKIYPESSPEPNKLLNPRKPFITATPGAGADGGSAIDVDALGFDYNLNGLIDFKGKTTIDFYMKQSRYPKTINILAFKGVDGDLKITESQHAKGRKLTFSYNNQRKVLTMPFSTKWEKHKITINGGRVFWDSKDMFSIPAKFSPLLLSCVTAQIDQLKIKSDGSELALDWQGDFAASVKTKLRDSQARFRIFGFDYMVISRDPAKRDCPVIQITNNTTKDQNIDLNLILKSEVGKLDSDYRQEISVPALSQQEIPLQLPDDLKTDLYHLTINSKAINAKYNFIYAKRRNEEPGSPKFGIHDFADKTYGYMPDALPIHYAHKYLRSWTQSYPWLRNPDKTWGLPADATPDRWYWNNKIDAIVRQKGVIPFVCIQAEPTAEFQRAGRPHHMRKFVWGEIGGMTNIDNYKAYAKEVMKRYKGKVRHWEIENEPNTGAHLGRYPEEYVKRLKANYEVIKSADPDAKIYGISGTSDWQPWMVKVFKLGGDKFMDGVSYHSYSMRAPATTLQTILDQTVASMPERFRKDTFNSETGILAARRFEVDKPLSAEEVERQVKLRHPAFVSKNAWPGAVLPEPEAARRIVQNAVVNFLNGAKTFVFFGFSASRRSAIKNKGLGASSGLGFGLFFTTPDGQMTPSLAALAVAVATTQLEGVELSDNDYRRVNSYAVTGGIFTKKDTSKVAVLWGNQATASCIIETAEKELELVSLFGQQSKVELKAVGNGKYFYNLKLTEAPVYVHSRSELRVLPGAVEGGLSVNTGGDSGKLTVNMANMTSEKATYEAKMLDSKYLTFSPSQREINLAANSTCDVSFDWKLKQKPSMRTIYATMNLISNGITSQTAFRIDLKEFRQVRRTLLPFEDFQDVDLKNFRDVCPLDKLHQVVLGAPPANESIQQDKYWKGIDELSAKVGFTWNKDGIIVGMKVKDQVMMKPEKGIIHGSCVELFFDFRPQPEFGSSRYTDGVFQFLISPFAGSTLTSPQIKDLAATGIKVRCEQIDKENYFFLMFVPWSLIEQYNTKMPRYIGFDIGVDGGDLYTKKRKSQLMLFGDSNNSKDASNFGIINIKK